MRRLALGAYALTVVLFLLWLPRTCLGGEGESRPRYELKIESRALSEALQEFARQSGIQILFFSQLTDGLRAPELAGAFTLDAAMNRLLRDSGLEFKMVNPQTVRVQRAATAVGTATVATSAQSTAARKDPLEEVRVIAEAEQLVATRIATPLQEIPQSISVVSAEQIRQQNDFAIEDVMRHATGIVASRADSQAQAYFGRTYQIQSFHVDGGGAYFPTTTGLVQGVEPDLSEFDRVEILRGSDALFSGKSNPGGTISLVRKRPLDTFNAWVTAMAGSWNSYRIESDLTGPLLSDGALRGRTDIVYTKNDFFYDTGHTSRKRVFGVVEWDPTPNGTLTLGGSYEWYDSRPVEQGWPVFQGDQTLPRDKPYAVGWQFDRRRLSEAYLQYRQEVAPGWNVKLNGGLWHVNWKYALPFFWDGLDAAAEPSQPVVAFTPQPTLIRQNTADATVTGVINPFGMRTEVAIGADFNAVASRDRDTRGGFGPPLGGPLDFDPGDYPAPDFARVVTVGRQDQHVSERQYGGFASVRMHLRDSLAVTAGVRVTSDTHSINNVFPDIDPPVSIAFSEGTRGVVTPLAGVMYQIDHHYSWYGSYADVYVSLGNAERSPGKLAAPVRGKTIETGLKGVWRDGALNGSLVLFWTAESGIPRGMVAGPDPEDSYCCLARTISSVSRGAEVEVSGEIAPGWLLAAGYTYNQVPTHLGGDLIAFSPRHLFKLWTSEQLHGPLERWNVGGSVTALSRIPLNATALCEFSGDGADCPGLVNTAQPGYIVVDLRTGFRINAHWQVALSVNNALNKNYFESYNVNFAEAWYGPPRNFTLRIDGKF